MRKPGWERVVTSDGHSPLLFYLVISATAVLAGILFVRLLGAIHLLVMPLH